ncbi:MAG: Ku protein [Candidatus Desulforudis sp.]|nr:Ku protein [Desulforudis sp.]
MRPIWKGAVTFGLVYIPVKLYTATEQRDVKFNYLHSRCHTRIRYRKFCPHCEEEVNEDEIVRGYEYEKGRYVVMDEDELENLTAGGGRNITLLDFVDLKEIDPVYYDRPYYLAPAEGGEKVYALLLEALSQSGKVGVARVAIRTKESLAVVRVTGPALLMSTMHYPDEVRPAAHVPELNYRADLHKNEVGMALSLVESLAAPFEPEKYRDDRREAVLELIRAKVTGETAVVTPPPQTEKVVDLMDALKSSIEQAKKERGVAKGAGRARAAGKPREESVVEDAAHP